MIVLIPSKNMDFENNISDHKESALGSFHFLSLSLSLLSLMFPLLLLSLTVPNRGVFGQPYRTVDHGIKLFRTAIPNLQKNRPSLALGQIEPLK